MMQWTDKEKAHIKTLVGNGLTFSEIAKILGRSRNAIAGVAGRIKAKSSPICMPRKRGKTVAAATAKPDRRLAQVRAGKMTSALRKARSGFKKAPLPDTELLAKVYDGDGVLLEALGSRQCHFPLHQIGDAPRYCGAPIVPDTKSRGRKYCGHHWCTMYRNLPSIKDEAK